MLLQPMTLKNLRKDKSRKKKAEMLCVDIYEIECSRDFCFYIYIAVGILLIAHLFQSCNIYITHMHELIGHILVWMTFL